MMLEKTELGAKLLFAMERTGDANLQADTPTADGDGPVCDFCEKPYIEGTGGTYAGMALCPSCYGRFVK